ncbi:MAG: hypothetical protein SOW56_02875, partial [Bacteroidaceae bacterium]|nr:hypothetical protein [Bacteroidaceae bacterium]
DKAELYSVRGSIEAEAGKDKLALYDFTKAIDLLPTVATNYVSRATIYRRMGKDVLADNDLKQAVALGADALLVENARKPAENGNKQ